MLGDKTNAVNAKRAQMSYRRPPVDARSICKYLVGLITYESSRKLGASNLLLHTYKILGLFSASVMDELYSA